MGVHLLYYERGFKWRWYDLGTISTHRPMQAKGFWHISVKLCKSQWLPTYKKLMTLYTYKLVDIWLFILTHQSLAMPSVLSLSHPFPSLPSFPISDHLPHPMTLLTAFPLQVIILYLILYGLAYCRITYLLSSSYIPSPRVHLNCHLNPFS
jgi:hypothetical protein